MRKVMLNLKTVEDAEQFVNVMRKLGVRGNILTSDGAIFPVSCFMVLLSLIGNEPIYLCIKESDFHEKILDEIQNLLCEY